MPADWHAIDNDILSIANYALRTESQLTTNVATADGVVPRIVAVYSALYI